MHKKYVGKLTNRRCNGRLFVNGCVYKHNKLLFKIMKRKFNTTVYKLHFYVYEAQYDRES